jgi:hypothetical protein
MKLADLRIASLAHYVRLLHEGPAWGDRYDAAGAGSTSDVQNGHLVAATGIWLKQ